MLKVNNDFISSIFSNVFSNKKLDCLKCCFIIRLQNVILQDGRRKNS